MTQQQQYNGHTIVRLCRGHIFAQRARCAGIDLKSSMVPEDAFRHREQWDERSVSGPAPGRGACGTIVNSQLSSC